MKAKILPILMLFVVITGLSKNANAATATRADYIILNDIKAINKIEVRGNVELFISDNATEQVKVYNKYYSEHALVQSSKGVLRITSYDAQKLVVWVSANDLRSVSAYDNAEVRSFGKFSSIDFSVDLHNNASATLNLDAYSANVTLSDNAKAELTGFAAEFSLVRNPGSTFTNRDFSASNYAQKRIGSYESAKADIMAGLE